MIINIKLWIVSNKDLISFNQKNVDVFLVFFEETKLRNYKSKVIFSMFFV